MDAPRAAAALEPSPPPRVGFPTHSEADVYTADIVDQRHGGPVTIGNGCYEAEPSIDVTLKVDEVTIVLEERGTVTSDEREMAAGPDAIVSMLKGKVVTIRSHARSALARSKGGHWRKRWDSNPR